MTLPIDPTSIDAHDIGQKEATLHMDHDEAVEHVRKAFTSEGFGVATEFSPSDLLAEKIGVDRDPYYVIGACNPRMANRVLDASENRVGALFPCNVVVWQEEPGVQRVYHVSIMKIARISGVAPDDEMMAEIVDETGEMVDAAWANLDAV